jgi:predicted ATPase
MKYLGLRNFRKFNELDPLELGGVTFLVGENNSGKSTFTKAAILLGNFLSMLDGGIDKINNQSNPSKKEFSFKSNEFRHVYIDSFYQALCNVALDGVISFEATIQDVTITVNVVEPSAFSNERNSSTATTIEEFSKCYPEIREYRPKYFKEELDKENAMVSSIMIDVEKTGVVFTLDYENCKINALLYDTDLREEHDRIIKDFSDGNFSEEHLDELLSRIDYLKQNMLLRKFSSNFILSENSTNLFELFFSSLDPDDQKWFTESLNTVNQVLENFKVEYIYAHSVHQLSSYSYDASGRNDYVDQTISKFYNQQKKYLNALIETDKSPETLVREWMDLLDIREDFVVKGETSLKLKSNRKLYVKMLDGYDEYDLSTKGIGFIQLFILLLRLATIVTGQKQIKTVVIEEPEQNLHPALQSRLADLFYKIYCDTGCQIIVETHSEYIVRRSQVIVSELDADKVNPFKVYYFPKRDAPYELKYGTNGAFMTSFGRGFFDEATRLHMQILNK